MLTFEQIDKMFSYLCRVYYDTFDVWTSDRYGRRFCFVDDDVLDMNFTDSRGLRKILQEKLGFDLRFNIENSRGNFFIYFGEDRIKVLHTRGLSEKRDVLYAYAEQKYIVDDCEVYLMRGSVGTWLKADLAGEPGLAYWVLNSIGASYTGELTYRWFMGKYIPYLHELQRGV